MKLPPILIGLASGLLLSACVSSPSMPPMASIKGAPPWECALKCPNPPPMSLHRQAWEVEALSWGLGCKALHDDCVDALNR